ncbi:hypothetical protein OQA88_7161 [Cercophora sp. LCS_1]
MAKFEALPPELLLHIAGYLPNALNVSRLSSCNRLCRAVLAHSLAKRWAGQAARWAAERGCLPTLVSALGTVDEDEKEALIEGPYNLNLRYDANGDEYQVPQTSMPLHLEPRAASLLHLACANGHERIVSYLIENGADLEAEAFGLCRCMDLSGYLSWSSDESHVQESSLAWSASTYHIGWFPLHTAICNKQENLARLLLDKGAPFLVCEAHGGSPQDPTTVSALQCAAENGLLSLVREFCEPYKGTEVPEFDESSLLPVNEPRWRDNNWYNVMHYVALCPDVEMVSALIEELHGVGLVVGEDGGPDDDESQPIGQLSTTEEIPALVADCLIDILDFDDNFGARFRVGWPHFNSTSVRQHRLECVQQLAQLITNTSEPDIFEDVGPLHVAAMRGHADELLALIELRARDINHFDQDNLTPLMAAAKSLQINTVQILLEAGAAVNTISYREVTALSLACKSSSVGPREGVVRALLANGATIGFLGDLFEGPQCSTLKLLLDHATFASLSRTKWQGVAIRALECGREHKSPHAEEICSALGRFGARVGYFFDDDVVGGLIGTFIHDEAPASLDLLFLLGGASSTIRTKTGCVTRRSCFLLALLSSCSSNKQRRSTRRSEFVEYWTPRNLIPVEEWTRPIAEIRSRGTIFHLLCAAGQLSAVRSLLDTTSVDVNLLDRYWRTPLGASILGTADEDLVDLLLEKGADPHMCSTPLLPRKVGLERRLALAAPGEKLARCVVETIAETDDWLVPYPCSQSPFQIAIHERKSNVIESLLKRSRLPSPCYPYVSLAIALYEFSVAGILLKAGLEFDPNAKIPLARDKGRLREQFGTPPTKAERKEAQAHRSGTLAGILHAIQAGAHPNRRPRSHAAEAIDDFFEESAANTSWGEWPQADELRHVAYNFAGPARPPPVIPCSAHDGCRKANQAEEGSQGKSTS